ncbi:hypothetical protein V9T40_002185 [Parthenolecanium corni]|uniref:Lipase domain-containing protein n=1 Tax=Parthenolecanium corni TaxID=536013 RepID=A0AAN9TFT6_9HEMI
MTAEANVFGNIVSGMNTVTNGVENAVEKVEEAAESLTDTSVEDKEVIFKYFNKDHREGIPFNIQEFNGSQLKGWRENVLLKVITHGWLCSAQCPSVVLIKDAYLEKYDFNLITVDWSNPANNNIYEISASETEGVGKIVARLLNDLEKRSLVTWENVNLLGHSLGGHVMGVAGANTKGKVGRLIGLDVAGPIFDDIRRPDARAFDSTDGAFVEAIHTAAGLFGLGSNLSLGHSDFFPNGGIHPQPGCSDIDIICSHARSYEFFAESIRNPNAFVGKLCENWIKFDNGDCNDNASALMGDPTTKTDVPKGVVLDSETVNENALTGWRKGVLLKMITHGWLASASMEMVQTTKDAYLQMHDYNIITVDWGKSAMHSFYLIMIHRAKIVGIEISKLIDKLVDQHIVTSDQIHLIGHSVGAHAMGVAGHFAKSGKVARITGLDAAKQGFDLPFQKKRNRLTPSDATFVDCIHTTTSIGYDESLGDVDFWPNGERYLYQPGCKGLICSHARAYEFFVDSILHPHTYLAHKCKNWGKYDDGKCAQEPTLYMGDETPTNAIHGDYFLHTSDKPPYGLGNNG